MTDLTQAIEELRSDGPIDEPWTASLVADGNPYPSSLAGAVATTLNAALSGDLIPKADADLAVALMVGEAASLCDRVASGYEAAGDAAIGCGVRLTGANIRTLVPASALAELQALRDERDRLDAVANTLSEMWEGEKARAEAAEAELSTLRAAEKELSDAYLRIREKLGAWNTTHGGADRFAVTEAAVDALRAQVERLTGLIQWAHDTLWELNPGNYGHDDVCKVNDAAVEVILGLAPIIGETHGHSVEWWEARAALSEGAAP